MRAVHNPDEAHKHPAGPAWIPDDTQRSVTSGQLTASQQQAELKLLSGKSEEAEPLPIPGIYRARLDSNQEPRDYEAKTLRWRHLPFMALRRSPLPAEARNHFLTPYSGYETATKRCVVHVALSPMVSAAGAFKTRVSREAPARRGCGPTWATVLHTIEGA